MAYADSDDLSDMLPDGLVVPADATRLLAAAGREIDRMLVTAVYDVDDGGDPTDAQFIIAFKDATCAQAAWWIETGDEQGVAAAVTSAGSGGGPYWSGGVPRVSPVAEGILRSAVSSSGVSLFGCAPWM